MQDQEMIQASRPQFRLERLQDRLLLSTTLADGSEVIDEVFVEEVPAEEYLVADPVCETVVPEGEWEDLMFYTMILPADELVDPMYEETGEEVYFGEEDGEIVMFCGFGELASEVEILVVDEGTIPDEVLMTGVGGETTGEVESTGPVVGPEQSDPGPVALDGISSDVLGSEDDLLGGGAELLG